MVIAQLKRYGPGFLFGLLAGIAIVLAATQSGLIVAQTEVTEIPVPGAVVPSYQLPGATPYAVAPEHVRGLRDSTTTLNEDLAPFANLDLSAAEEGQCVQWRNGRLGLGLCAEIAVTGSFTGYVAYSADRTFTAAEFTTGSLRRTFTGDYTSTDEFSARYTDPPAPTTSIWAYDDSPCRPGVSPLPYCGYVGLAIPAPPGRPLSEGGRFPSDIDEDYFTQGTLTINGVEHTIIVSQTSSTFPTRARTSTLNWSKWTGSGLPDIADPGAPAAISDNAWQPGQPVNRTGRTSPGSNATMIVGWWPCPDNPTQCPEADIRAEVSKASNRFESGATFAWPDKTGTQIPFIAYLGTTSAPATITTTGDTSTNLRNGWSRIYGINGNDFPIYNLQASRDYFLLRGPAQTNPTNFQRIISR